jgi:predicted nucleic acid-binding protein
MERVDLSLAVLRRAAEPFPTPLGTLDALHLATAVLWGAQQDALPAFATHDQQLGTAARALGMRVVGV